MDGMEQRGVRQTCARGVRLLVYRSGGGVCRVLAELPADFVNV
jgi:hypothetical protein